MPSFVDLQIQDSLSAREEHGKEREGLWVVGTVTGIFRTGYSSETLITRALVLFLILEKCRLVKLIIPLRQWQGGHRVRL